MHVYTHCVFDFAMKGYRETMDAEDDNEGDQPGAIPAIVFAVATIESFANELAAYARRHLPMVHQGVDLRPLVGLWEDRDSIERKICMARFLLADEPFDRGAEPFQSLKLLTFIRNAIVHPRPEDDHIIADGGLLLIPWKKFHRKCDVKNLLSHTTEESRDHHAIRIRTRAAARFACETAVEIIVQTVDPIPDGHFRFNLDWAFYDNFIDFRRQLKELRERPPSTSASDAEIPQDSGDSSDTSDTGPVD